MMIMLKLLVAFKHRLVVPETIENIRMTAMLASSAPMATLSPSFSFIFLSLQTTMPSKPVLGVTRPTGVVRSVASPVVAPARHNTTSFSAHEGHL